MTFLITKIQTSILTCEIEVKNFDEATDLVNKEHTLDSHNLRFIMQYDGTINGNEEIQIEEVK